VTHKPIVSFDLDGTLVDSVRDLAAALNAALVEVGLAPHSVDDVRGFVGRGARNLVLRAVTARGHPELCDDVLARFRVAYEASLLAETHVFSGITEVLSTLAPHATLVVSTNKPGMFARPLVQALLPGRFAFVVGPDDAGVLKPDARFLAYVAERAGGRVSAHVGDSPVDLEAARAVGAAAIAVGWGLAPPSELAGADAFAAQPADLVDVLARLLRFSPHATESP
jgi:phosphoglycolate phosphatase